MEKKLTIALMSYSMDNRRAKGTALYTRTLIEGLLADGHHDYFLVHYDAVDDPLYRAGHEILMPHVGLPYGSHFISQLLFFWKYRKQPFDIIHWFQPRVYPFYWFAPAKKIVVTMHGAGDITAPRYFVFSRLVFNIVLKYFHRWIDKVIVVSQDAKNEVVKYYGFSPATVETIYNGGGENYHQIEKSVGLEVAREKYHIPGPYIFDVSRFLPHKNVISLIRAYDRLRHTYPLRTERLVIAGGSMYKSTHEHAARQTSAFSGDIIFIDYVDAADLNALYSGAELFVFPSLDEGFGLPILEAMASGTPVVTSNRASMPEIGGDAVVLVDPLSIDELVRAMHTVLTDTAMRQKMIAAGLARAKEFTWHTMVRKTEELYQNLA